jgi:hypothetical protein
MSEPENWERFRGSEIGGLLSNIYGTEKTVVRYPKLSKKKADSIESHESSRIYIREIAKKKGRLSVPKVGLEKSILPSIAAVDSIARRKKESTIKVEVDEMRSRQIFYRPAYSHSLGEQEKEKLNQICQCKGGKILPEDLAYPITKTPLEVAATLKDNLRRREFAESRRPSRSLSNAARPPLLSQLEQMKEQVAGEISERTVYLQDLRNVGLRAPNESRIRTEILLRVNELKRMNGS